LMCCSSSFLLRDCLQSTYLVAFEFQCSHLKSDSEVELKTS
jgi:hypothetical protein